MDLTVVNKRIQKISGLLQTLDETNISSLERDLLKNYICELYEAVLISSSDKTNGSSIQKQEKLADQFIQQAVPSNRQSMPVRQEKIEPKVNLNIEQMTHVDTTLAMIAETTKQSEYVPDAKLQPEQNDPLLEELFTFDKGSDLSDKLANSPITDLSKVMGINEKIFTIQELFKGNTQLFDHTILKLNGLSTFDEAKSYLVENVVYPCDWLTDQRIKKAGTFIKLIKRKFTS